MASGRLPTSQGRSAKSHRINCRQPIAPPSRHHSYLLKTHTFPSLPHSPHFSLRVLFSSLPFTKLTAPRSRADRPYLTLAVLLAADVALPSIRREGWNHRGIILLASPHLLTLNTSLKRHSLPNKMLPVWNAHLILVKQSVLASLTCANPFKHPALPFY